MIRTICLLGAAFSSFAWARTSIEEFQNQCRAHRNGAEVRLFRSPKIGEVEFVPTSAIAANQRRFSFAAITRKLLKKGDEYEIKHNDGTSFFSRKKALKGIYFNGLIYLIDGHHRAAISSFVGSPTTPMEVIADLSGKYTAEEFENFMARNYYSYLHNYQGQTEARVDLCDMVDDPNLELARLLISRVDVTLKEDGSYEFDAVDSKRMVIGIKTSLDIPYLEFEIADALRRAGIVWDNDRTEELSKDELKRFLKILKEEQKVEGSRLKYVLIFDKPISEDKIDYKELVVPHLEKLGCEAGLRGKLREVQ